MRALRAVAFHDGPCTGDGLASCSLAVEALKALHEGPGLPPMDVHRAEWDAGFGALLDFVYREGHAHVPAGHVEHGVRLGAWAGRCRAERRVMPGERRARLGSVPGWSWGRHEDEFDGVLAALTVFVAREGHCRVPAGHVEGGVRLSWWTRRLARLGPYIGHERQAALDAVPGWRWDRGPGGGEGLWF